MIDEDVMSNVSEGNVQMLAILFERYHVRLYNYFLRLTGNKGTGEDLAQEVFFRILKYRTSYRRESKFTTWMYQIGRNVFIDHLKKHKEELENVVLENGKKLDLVPLVKPNNKMYSTSVDSTRPPFESKSSLTTYLNFYIANEVVLVPVYGDVMDSTAKTIIAEHFPGRDIVGIPAWATAELGGMMHCVTQQQPEVKKEG